MSLTRSDPINSNAHTEWSFAAAQARQTRAILCILAISFCVGPACLVFHQATIALARTLSVWLPAVEKLLSRPGSDPLAAQVVAANITLMPVYVVLLSYRQTFANSFRAGTGQAGWSLVQALLISYFVLLPVALLFLAITLLAPFEFSDAPHQWGERYFTAMFASRAGVLTLVPVVAAGFGLLVYAVWFFCWLPFSLLRNAVLGNKE